MREQCAKANVRLQVLVELDADLGQIKHRLNARDETSAEISDARLEDFDELNRRYEAPSELSFRELITASSATPPETTLLGVLKKLVQLQLETTP